MERLCSIKSFILDTSVGVGVCLILIPEYFYHHISKLVWYLGHHSPIELSVMIEMFQWAAGAGFYWLVAFTISFSGILRAGC